MLDSGLHRLILLFVVPLALLLLPQSGSALCDRKECTCTPVEPQSVNFLKSARCVFEQRKVSSYQRRE
jgi:hypothetical protein